MQDQEQGEFVDATTAFFFEGESGGLLLPKAGVCWTFVYQLRSFGGARGGCIGLPFQGKTILCPVAPLHVWLCLVM